MFDLFRAKIKKLVRFAPRPSIPKIGQEAFFIIFYYLASEIHNSVIYPAYETLRIYTAVFYMLRTMYPYHDYQHKLFRCV
mgnify:FL=1